MAFWSKIVEWFQDRSDRKRLIESFNASAREAWISGSAPTMFKARVSKGDGRYKTAMSSLFNSGFRITTLAGRQLTKQELVLIGQVVLENVPLVRRMVALGFDTLEIHSDVGAYGCKWKLSDYAQIGMIGYTASNNNIEGGL